MSDDYTPSIEDLRDMWHWHFYEGTADDNAAADADWDDDRMYAQFDRALAAHDAEIRADAWDEGAASRQCKCAAWEDGECGCGNYPPETNPYRTPRPRYELFPGVMDKVNALTIYGKPDEL